MTTWKTDARRSATGKLMDQRNALLTALKTAEKELREHPENALHSVLARDFARVIESVGGQCYEPTPVPPNRGDAIQHTIWDTGRLYATAPRTHVYHGYSATGQQVIRARVLYFAPEECRVEFNDLARGIDGYFMAHPGNVDTQDRLAAEVMRHYDHNLYTGDMGLCAARNDGKI